MQEVINIAICLDNNVKYYASTMLVSLFENNKEEEFHIFIVTDLVYTKEIEYIYEIIKKYKHQYTLITLSEKHKTMLSKMIVNLHITYFAYIRLLLPELIPAAVEKILYLDIDLIVVDKIQPLWSMDISKYSLGAIVLNSRELNDELKEAKELLGVPLVTSYFNSGVLLMNLSFFRKSDIIERMIQFIIEHPNFIKYWDQDALNLFLHDTFLEIDKCWNMDLHNALTHPEIKPKIIHYTGSLKPLSGYNTHPYIDEFYKYFKKNYLYKFYIIERIKQKIWRILNLKKEK